MIHETSSKRPTTSELSRQLARDLTPSRPLIPLSTFLGLWLAASVAFFLPGLLLAPTRVDLLERLSEGGFWLETMLWVIMAVVSAAMVYRSSIPGLMKKNEPFYALLPLGLICAFLASRLQATGFATELVSEMDLWRGRCGFVILGVGFGAGALLFRWARRAAPTQPRLAGIWAALCAGSLGSFAMQVVCAHDNALHLWVWHILPVGMLVFAGAWFGFRKLRWRAEPISS